MSLRLGSENCFNLNECVITGSRLGISIYSIKVILNMFLSGNIKRFSNVEISGQKRCQSIILGRL